MGGALGVLVVVVVALALVSVVAIGLGLVGTTAATLIRRRRPDPLAVELDRVLEDILAQPSGRGAAARCPAVGLRHSERDHRRLH